MIKISRLPLGPMATNAYIVYENKEALVFDPGGDFDKLQAYLEERELDVKAVLLTHAHFDHIGAVDQVRSAYDAPVYLHEAEADWLDDPSKNGSGLFQIGQITAQPADRFFAIGQMEIGNFTFEVRHTPGHSPGSVSFVFRNQRFTIAGDTLFQRGMGRTDLPGGSREQLETSIREQLFSLRNDMRIYPGHGLPTTIEEEKNENPFFT
ncbi:MBL fold metallo-hydrolase [Halobacillus yeomjeoni]|uniref:MBL fold metallo-hydrolase n=1 Tax=Halobacillus yeomjeoni TaxID=311194 RepID=A0A931HUA2_9BACI|nr:MBL fold metallo-hydrolase [Halobacillus yeomjeoni]MBH0229865.1 MBL fold metallo-hydrolase [Halobacillus yeomjeoni]